MIRTHKTLLLIFFLMVPGMERTHSETIEPAEEVGAEVQDSIEADEAEVGTDVEEESEVAVEEGGEVEVEPEDAELADPEEDFEATEDEDCHHWHGYFRDGRCLPFA